MGATITRTRRWAPRLTVVAMTAILTVGCGGDSPDDATAEVAAGVCDVYGQLLDGDLEALFDDSVIAQLEDLEAQATEAELTDADIESAIRATCPDTLAELEERFGAAF